MRFTQPASLTADGASLHEKKSIITIHGVPFSVHTRKAIVTAILKTIDDRFEVVIPVIPGLAAEK